MTDARHLFEPGGWRLTYKDTKDKVCSELLPDTGTTILIGQPRNGRGCSAVWMDRAGVLRTIQLGKKGDQWEARVKHGSSYYVITLAYTPIPRAGAQPKIEGKVKPASGRAAIRRPPGEYEAQGTWGAEANPGG